MKKLVVLDAFSVNSGDFSWDDFSKFVDEIKIYDRTNKDEVFDRIKDASYILACKSLITRDIIEKCNNLEYIGSMATGFNHIDVEFCNQKNIVVTNVPDYSTNAVSELVFALIFEACRKVSEHNDRVQKGEWINSKDFCFYNDAVFEIANKTIGILGYGNIGKKVSKIAQAFDMKVLVHTRTKREDTENVKFVSKEELFKNSDIITLHCPLNDETKEIINKDSISKMKDGVIIVNTGRGPLINEIDLRDALNSKKVGYALLDVVSVEPMKKDNPLLNVENCIITPHYGWCPFETRKRLFDILMKNLENFVKGNPINVIK